ncbi:MAG: dihydropteroate synthase [Candidatus Omnitrophota bacterium]
MAKVSRRRIPRIPDFDIKAGDFDLALSKRTYVMGVLNVTPDSFSEKGQFFDAGAATAHALQMARDGADIIDIGGESTRPGAGEVAVEEELDRVIPVIKALAGKLDIPLSIDTRRAEVAEAAIEEGASIVNDVSGLKYDPGMARVAGRHGAAVIAMHMRASPRDMQSHTSYADLMRDIIRDLKGSVAIARKGGIERRRIIVDPGIGFAKTAGQSLEVIGRLAELGVLGQPVCVGPSRKSFIGKVLAIDDPKERVTGTVAACAIAAVKGARIVRVHDVKEAVQAVRIADSITQNRIVN